MSFSALRHHFGRKVGEEYAGQRPVVGVSSSVLEGIFAPLKNLVVGLSHDQMEQSDDHSL